MSELDLDVIERRVERATDGPWTISSDDGIRGGGDMEGYPVAVGPYGGGMDEGDAEFVAHAREDVPALIAEVRQLREQTEAMRTFLRRRTLDGERTELDLFEAHR